MTSSHVGRIRRLRSPDKQSLKNSNSPKDNTAQDDASSPNGVLIVGDGFDENREESLQGTGIYEIQRLRRFVAVTDSDDEVTTHMLLELSCLLIEGSIIVITAVGDETENGIEAEAEIGLDELLYLKNSPDAGIKNDLPQLRKLVSELLDSIDVRIEEGLARLVLNISSDVPLGNLSDALTTKEGQALHSPDNVISEENEYADDEFD